MIRRYERGRGTKNKSPGKKYFDRTINTYKGRMTGMLEYYSPAGAGCLDNSPHEVGDTSPLLKNLYGTRYHSVCITTQNIFLKHWFLLLMRLRRAWCLTYDVCRMTYDQGTYNLAGIYGPQLESLQSILEETNLRNSDRMVEALPQKLTREMLTAFSSSKEQIRSQLEEAILSR